MVQNPFDDLERSDDFDDLEGLDDFEGIDDSHDFEGFSLASTAHKSKYSTTKVYSMASFR